MDGSPRKPRSKSIGHYVLMKTIGEGTFGKVKLGTHILTGERVAVKVLEKERIVDIADVERVAREIHILKLIRQCRHIIQLYEIIETPRQLYLIMEYASGGELFDYIVRHGRAEEREACRILHQILAGVERVHAMCVVHRDLKPENLLLDDAKHIKIADFGLSNTHQEGQLLQTACGSPCYAAPEMIAGHRYEPNMVDIWSCGVILFALVCGYLPFEDQNHTELYRKILNAEYEIPNFLSRDVSDLITGILTTDPTKRMTLADIRKHRWYCQMPEASLVDRADDGEVDEAILEQLDSYGFPRDYSIKCLQSNKHNHVTTTYYLIREKRLRAHAEGQNRLSAAIADLNATGLEEEGYAAPDPAHAAALRGENYRPSANGLSEEMLDDGDTPGAPSRVRQGDGAGSRATRPPGRGRASSGPPAATPRAVPATARPSTAYGQPQYGGGATGGGGGCGGYGPWVEAPAPPPYQRRRPASRAQSAHGGTAEAYGLWSDPPASPLCHGWRDVAPPLSARPRLQGNARGREHVHPAGHPGGPRDGKQGHGGVPAPQSARGRSRGEWADRGPGTLQVSCGVRLPPKQIVQEVVRALAAQEVGFRQVSNFLVRCEAPGGVRFQAEVVQQDHGGGYSLRFSRVSGEIRHYRDICARLLAEMHL